jgi:phospholipase D1/2
MDGMARVLSKPAREDEQLILAEGRNCWRVSQASRATLLIDAEQYYCALRTALLKARRQILIAAWDLDTRIHLPADGAGTPVDARFAPTQLGELLGYLIRSRPGLEIEVLCWDPHPIYARDRELGTKLKLERMGVRFHRDGCHPPTGSVHHKVVVIDDALAFCGGIDLTHHRWDTCEHAPRDERRVDHAGRPYAPTHDVQLCVSGPIARVLGDYLRDCWQEATGRRPDEVAFERELWPDRLRVDFQDVRVGLSRTVPARNGSAPVREIEALYLAAIAAARRELYFENQYFTNERIARAIADRCRREPDLSGLLVGCRRARTWIEQQTMGYGRSRFREVLASSGALDRVPLVAALNEAGESILVHSKLGIFDDRLLTVGSANLNRRSAGFDVECNLSIEALNERERAGVRELRNRLLAEHLDLDPLEVPALVESHGLAQLPRLARGRRRLVPVELEPPHDLGAVLAPLFDPEQPEPSLVSRIESAPVRSWQQALVLFCLACYFRLTNE